MFVCPSVRLLSVFLEIGSLVFSDFWHKDAKWQCPKCDGAWFSKKKFFRPKLPEVAVFADFVWFFSSYFAVFSHKNIINSNTYHQACFNCQKKTDFWSWNCLKIARTANFRWKNTISWIFWAVLDFFSWNFAPWCKIIMFKMWQSPIFEKNIFVAKNAGNIPKKMVFWHFLKILLIFGPTSEVL